MNDNIWDLWFKKARSNLARAELGKITPDILYEDLCYDAQQATEKALKGLMAYLKFDIIPKTHSIGYLIKLIEDDDNIRIPGNLREASVLTDYAVTTRYPGDWEPVTQHEYNQAVLLAQEVYRWVLTITQNKDDETVK